MRRAEMPAQGPPAKSAFEANDMVGLHRSPDRHRRRQRFRQGCRRVCPEATEGAMHRRDQPRNLIDADTVLRDITCDDLRNHTGEDLLRGAFISHIVNLMLFEINVVEGGLFAISSA